MKVPISTLLVLLILAPGSRVVADVMADATALVAAQRLPEAREPLEALIAAEPSNVAARVLLAQVYNGLGRRDQGIELLEPLVEAYPSDPRLLGEYAGQCMLRAGELGAGLRALRLARRGRDFMERAVALDPTEIAYREGLVDFYQQAPRVAGGSLAKARAHADAISRIDPVRGGAWLAAIYVREERFEEALAASDAALAARPDDYLALFALGRTVSESGQRLEDGERALRRCLEKVPTPSEPTRAAVFHRLGLIAERRGDAAAARAAFRSSLAQEPFFRLSIEGLKRVGDGGGGKGP